MVSQINNKILSKIISSASSINTSNKRILSNYREDIAELNASINDLTSSLPPLDQFKLFLVEVHNVFIRADTNIRSILLRLIRIYAVKENSIVESILDDRDIIWLIVLSFERESEYVAERMQAYKLMKLFLHIKPSNFPVSLARSVVAVASQKDDQFRKASIELLRMLCISNTLVFSHANATPVILESILDPSFSDLAESLLLSFLHVLSDKSTRSFLNPRLDIRYLLSPWTDLDIEANVDKSTLWNCSKNAFIILMRSWPGIILLTSDDLGLPVVVKLLQEPKVSKVVQEVILDAFIEIFKPFVSETLSPRNYLYSNDISVQVEQNGNLGESLSTGDFPRTLTSSTNRSSTLERTTSYIPGKSTNSLDDIDVKSRSRSIDTTGNPSYQASHGYNGASSSKQNGRGFLSSIFSSSKSAPKTKPPKPTNSNNNTSNSYSSEFDRSSFEVRQTDFRISLFDNSSSDENGIDSQFNLVDSYTALLCCSTIKAKLLDSVCYLAIHGENILAQKSKQLLVDILRVVSRIFPESSCTDLLSMPYLIEYASFISEKLSSRTEKASNVLFALAEAFSLSTVGASPRRNLVDTEKIKVADDDDQSNSGFASDRRPPSSLKQLSTISESLNSGSSFKLGQTVECQTIFDVTDELKRISHPELIVHNNGSLFSSSMKLTEELRLALISVVDKTDFSKQLDNCGIIGKDGKEPFKWDWPLINDMLEFSFQNPERLTEALKTKFIRRLAGFYRCTNDDKAYFASLDWSIENMIYLDVASNLIHLLTDDDIGFSFLTTDRRGLIFNEISTQLELLIESSQRVNSITTNQSIKNVFRPWGCTYSMAREYLTLLGRITSTSGGRRLMDETKVFQQVSALANYNNLEYLARLCITALTFSDKGIKSKSFLQLWASSTSCSPDFKLYLQTLLLTLLLSRPNEFYEWGLDVLTSFLASEDFVTSTLQNILIVASQDKSLLRQIIGRRLTNLVDENFVKPVLIRFACLTEGVDYLRSTGALAREMASWKDRDCIDYVAEIDRLMAYSFIHVNSHGKIGTSSLPLGSAFAIPVTTTSYGLFSKLQQPLNVFQRNDTIGIKSQLSSQSNDSSQSKRLPAQQIIDCNGAALDLEGLLLAPWSIEAKISNSTNSQANADYFRVDTYLDLSELQTPMTSTVISDDNRILKIRGVVMDQRGFPGFFPVAISKSVSATLLIGINAVHRSGNVISVSEARINKRKIVSSIPIASASSRDVANPRRTSVVSPPPVPEDTDNPISHQLEYLFDWSTCKPIHRQSGVTELGDGLFSVEIPGEPAKFIFSRIPSATANSSKRRTSETSTVDSGIFTPNRSTTGYVYLKEIHYYLRLQTNQSLFVPMPRHFYGELARSVEGRVVLKEYGVVKHLMYSAKSDSTADFEKAAALWALGHIGSNEIGLLSVLHYDPTFIEWCIDNVIDCPSLSLRGTFFQVLGLIGKTRKGFSKLSQLGWNCSPTVRSCAVAIPRDLGVLFTCETLNMELENSRSFPVTQQPETLQGLSPFLSRGETSPSIEFLNLIAKLPGIVPIFKESKARIEQIRHQHAEIFSDRQLYKAVQDLLSCSSFKLSLRREVMKYFEVSAKLK